MSPEYAYYGQFSVKSDVFSFGVLVIEIVTGKKCTRFLGSESATEDLLSFVSSNINILVLYCFVILLKKGYDFVINIVIRLLVYNSI